MIEDMPKSDATAAKRGRPSLKEAQRKLREDAILDATYELLLTKGYAAMTLDDVLEAVGIAKATLYQHFSSKEELAAHVVARKMESIKAYFVAQDPTLSAGERLRQFIPWFVDLRYRGMGIRLCDLANFIRPSGGQRSIVAELEDEITNLIERLIIDAQSEGSIRNDVSSTVLTQTLISTVRDDGYEPLVRSGHIQIEQIIDGLLKLMQRG